MTFFDPFYRALASIGYQEPVHPPFTHYPIALMTASLLFGLVALLWRRPVFWVTARHCLVLAWLFLLPTILFGFMDWQHYYHGEWVVTIIVKIYLTIFLFVMLSLGLILEYKGLGSSRAILTVFVLSFIAVVGVGYFGGKLVYEGMEEGRGAAVASVQVKVGQEIYAKNCLACHPDGGNIFTPQAPLRSSQSLADFPKFLSYIRAPRLSNGQRGPMPDFTASQISDNEARELYRYMIYEFGKPKPQER